MIHTQCKVVFEGPNGEALIQKTPDVCGVYACFRYSCIMVLPLVAANKKIPDPQVLDLAIGLRRAVVTLNRWHFTRLHKKKTHFGIIICTDDRNFFAFAERIHQAIIKEEPLDDKLLRINKPSKP